MSSSSLGTLKLILCGKSVPFGFFIFLVPKMFFTTRSNPFRDAQWCKNKTSEWIEKNRIQCIEEENILYIQYFDL